MSSLCISSPVFILIQRTFRSSYTLIITSRYKTDSEQFLLSLFFSRFLNFAESITNGRMYEPRNIRKC